MPVVVTAADHPLGRAVVEALVAEGSIEVRATVRDPGAAAELIALGVRTAVSDLVDPLRFGAVLEGAHTVVHLDDPPGTWDLLLDAAADTGLRRIVTVLDPADEMPPPVPYQLVVIRSRDRGPRSDLVAALLDADRRRSAPVACRASPRVQKGTSSGVWEVVL
jgi:putative NAD(P)-binding protein